ncbi:MAG: hypothetical protein IPN76_07475 [Saprospiraceae bacterium]|nr:hypothetical protein [Saprospiraceae bacterium]
MKPNFRFFLLHSTCLLCLCASILMAQPVNTLTKDVVMPSPNAAALGKYGDIPIDYSSGTPSISIPLYSIGEGNINLPISLNYHGSGVVVGEPASWVGLGWSLNTGGMVSRTVMGIPDEGPNGYWSNANTIDTSLRSYICEMSLGNKDGEPDIFSYNVPGYSGKFFYDKDNNLFKIPKNPDLKIEKVYDSGSGGGFVSFTVITPDGTRYVFGKDADRNITAYELQNVGSSSTWRSTWMLLRIESFDKKFKLLLDYDSESYSYKTLASCKYTISNFPTVPNNVTCPGSNGADIPKHDYIHQYMNAKRLKSIKSSTDTLTFIAITGREDLESGSYRLDTLKLKSGGFCSRFVFSYAYFEDPLIATYNYSYFKRLQLTKLQKFSCNGAISENAHDFTYEGPVNNGKVFLPHRLSKAIDHWGYYNGKHTPNEGQDVNVPPTTLIHPISGDPIPYGGSNRDSDTTYLKYGMLKQVTYPTGGNTVYSFEANTAQYVVPGQKTYFIQNLTTCGTPGPSCCGNLVNTQNVTFNSSADISGCFFDLEIVGNANYATCSSCYFQAKIQIFNGATQIGPDYFITATCSPYFENVIKVPLAQITTNLSPNISYTFKVSSTNGKGTFSLYHWPNVTTSW